MKRIITFEDAQVDVEKSCYDLALIYSQARLEKRLRERPDMDEKELIFHLQDDFFYSYSYMNKLESEVVEDMLDTKVERSEYIKWPGDNE